MLKEVCQRLTDIVFPPYCLICEASLEAKAHVQFCRGCVEELTHDAESLECLQCGAHLAINSLQKEPCVFCPKRKLPFDQVRSLGNYEGQLRKIILELKRVKSDVLAFQLGVLLGDRLKTTEFHNCDAIIPAPIHWWKRFRKGFNAAELIALGLAKQIQLPIWHDVVRLTRLTQKQGTLSTTARIQNMKNSIAVRKSKKISGKRLIVVDDVMTSGATATEIAKTLRESGAKATNLAVAARGVRAF